MKELKGSLRFINYTAEHRTAALMSGCTLTVDVVATDVWMKDASHWTSPKEWLVILFHVCIEKKYSNLSPGRVPRK